VTQRLPALGLALAFALAQAAPASAASARDVKDLCRVMVVDVAKGLKAEREHRERYDPERRDRAFAAAEVVLPEFSTVRGEEELTTKTYRFPGSRLLYITASVFYTDESMSSEQGADSMMLAVAVSRRRLREAVTAEDNAVAELTSAGFDTARVTKRVWVGGRLYILELHCNRKRTPDGGQP
jgi:hypothetical protein